MSDFKIKCIDCKNEYDLKYFTSPITKKSFKNCAECRSMFIYRRNLELTQKGERWCSSCKSSKKDEEFYSKKHEKYLYNCYACRKSYMESQE